MIDFILQRKLNTQILSRLKVNSKSHNRRFSWMSSSALQVAKTATYLPDLVEVQRASFKWFLKRV